jgi:hypothetical protein
MGALDVYGDEHNFIVFPCAPVVFTPPSYFVDHHLVFLFFMGYIMKES